MHELLVKCLFVRYLCVLNAKIDKLNKHSLMNAWAVVKLIIEITNNYWACIEMMITNNYIIIMATQNDHRPEI